MALIAISLESWAAVRYPEDGAERGGGPLSTTSRGRAEENPAGSRRSPGHLFVLGLLLGKGPGNRLLLVTRCSRSVSSREGPPGDRRHHGDVRSVLLVRLIFGLADIAPLTGLGFDNDALIHFRIPVITDCRSRNVDGLPTCGFAAKRRWCPQAQSFRAVAFMVTGLTGLPVFRYLFPPARGWNPRVCQGGSREENTLRLRFFFRPEGGSSCSS